MIFALAILVPMVAVATWAFFRFSPVHADHRRVLLFNVASMVIALATATAWTLRTYLVMSPTVDAAWWPIISVLGTLVLTMLVLGLAGVVRNFIVFRRGPGETRPR